MAGLPRELPAACFAVLHRELGHPNGAAEILNGLGTLAVRIAEDGDPLRHGTLLLAPPDRHLIVREDCVRLSAGARENFWRPSIDVLFRTAAVAHRSRAVGVVLSGTLDDGAAGLAAVRACGGEALVQDPSEAAFADMPDMALREVEGARALTLEDLSRELRRLAVTEAPPAPSVPPELELEARIVGDGSNFVAALGMPDQITLYTCPECGGPLAEQHDRPMRFRCVVGHGFTVGSLQEGMRRQTESSLWVAIRLLQQRSTLSRALSDKEREKGRSYGAQTYGSRADEAATHADVLRRLLMELNSVDQGAANADTANDPTAVDEQPPARSESR